MELSKETIDQLREVYGTLADCIGIRKINTGEYEIAVLFYQRFRTSELDREAGEYATRATAYNLCNTIEKIILERAPNRTTNPNQCMPDVKFHVSRNVPEGMIFISPKTYYEMMGRD